MSKSKGILKTAGFMAIATLLAKICGLAREVLIAAYFSTGIEGTAYLTATQLPMTLFDIVIGGVISASFIPIFNDILEKRNKKDAMEFANRFICIILLICIIISAVGIIFTDGLINLIAPEFDAATHDLSAFLSSIMFPMIIFTGLAFSFVGILQTFGEFNIPAVMSLISNLAVIIYFPVFGKKFGVYGLSVAMLFSWSLQVFVQIPSLKKFGFKFRPTLKLWNEDIKRALLLAGPMLISTWVQPLYSIVNTRLASGIEGAVPVLNYANRLYIVVTGVFSFVVTNLIFPKLSRANSADNQDEAKTLISTSLKAVSMVILPIMAVFIILSEPIINVIYNHGEFDAVRKTSIALACYSVGMLGMSVNEVLSKSFFSMQNSKIPMVNAVISMIFNIILAYTLSPRFEIGGLALATAGGSIMNAILNYICMIKKNGSLFAESDRSDIRKIIMSALVMSAVVFGLYSLLKSWAALGTMQSLASGIVCGAGGIIAYAMCLYFLGESEIRMILKKK